MSCCDDKDDDGILENLLLPTQTLTLTLTLASSPRDHPSNPRDPNHLSNKSISSTISPMNSNFCALTSRDILRTILERLPLADLARSACVCRLWNSIASDGGIQAKAFKSPWKLKDIIGKPTYSSFWRDNSIGRFAISHCLKRGDSIASLALKYCVQVMDIKRLNNMMSDHGIYSRERLLIPISNPEVLRDTTCYIELDIHARREVAVLYLEGRPDGKVSYLANKATTETGKKRIADSMKRSFHLDDGVAEYYLSISNGDPRAAFSEFSNDLRWEDHARAC